MRYDAIVVGGGHNGLVTAAYLARAGHYVVVLERRALPGGAMATEEIFPGFKCDSCASNLDWLPQRITSDLELERHGLTVLHGEPTIFAPLPDGDHLLLGRENGKTCEAIRRFSRADAERWGSFNKHVARLTGFLEALYAITPPNLMALDGKDLLGLLELGGHMRQFGRKDAVELMRTLPMSVAEFLDEWFEAEVLKSTVGTVGVRGILQGPYASGTAYVLLHHLLGSPMGALRSVQFARGGVGNLVHALTNAAKRYGVEIRTNAEVTQVIVQDGRATGVTLKSGEEISARAVISNADPKRTFFELVDPLHLGPRFLRKVRNIKFRGACAKVNLALSELPTFSALPGDGPHLRGLISISPNLDYLEHAYDDAKYGGISREPYLEVVIPSLVDPTLTPHDAHVMSIFVQYAPYHLNEGKWDEAQREALGNIVVDTLSEYAPNLKGAVLQRQVITPLDLEQEYGLTEGSIYHGELLLDQILFMRPVPGWAQYRTPIQNLYLCGAGTHPGGGVLGAPGYNAAREVLRDIKRNPQSLT